MANNIDSFQEPIGSSCSEVDSLASFQNHCKPQFTNGMETCKINISGYSLDNFKTLDLNGYTILCRMGEACDGLNFYPISSKVVLDISDTSKLAYHANQILPNIASDLGVNSDSARQTAVNFFKNKDIIIQPKGIQGKIYKGMLILQNNYPIYYTTQLISMARISGVAGFQIIKSSPLTFVGATYLGAIFFSYASIAAGKNYVGLALNSVSYTFALPMKFTEMVLNGLVLRPLSQTIGLPLLLNGTTVLQEGAGMTIRDYGQIFLAFERISNSTIVRKAKKLYKALREKD